MSGLISTYRKQLSKEIEKWIQETGQGGANSWDDYKRRSGVIHGLQTALNLFNDIVKKSYEDDSEPEE